MDGLGSDPPTVESDRDDSRSLLDHSRRGRLRFTKGNLEVCLCEIRVCRGARTLVPVCELAAGHEHPLMQVRVSSRGQV